MISAGAVIELAAVASRDDDLFAAALAFLVEPLHAEQAIVAGRAYRRYGRGHHPASLNLSDVFAYMLARHRNLPLLFKGGDFVRTDIESA